MVSMNIVRQWAKEKEKLSSKTLTIDKPSPRTDYFSNFLRISLTCLRFALPCKPSLLDQQKNQRAYLTDLYCSSCFGLLFITSSIILSISLSVTCSSPSLCIISSTSLSEDHNFSNISFAIFLR